MWKDISTKHEEVNLNLNVLPKCIRKNKIVEFKPNIAIQTDWQHSFVSKGLLLISCLKRVVVRYAAEKHADHLLILTLTLTLQQIKVNYCEAVTQILLIFLLVISDQNSVFSACFLFILIYLFCWNVFIYKFIYHECSYNIFETLKHTVFIKTNSGLFNIFSSLMDFHFSFKWTSWTLH